MGHGALGTDTDTVFKTALANQAFAKPMSARDLMIISRDTESLLVYSILGLVRIWIGFGIALPISNSSTYTYTYTYTSSVQTLGRQGTIFLFVNHFLHLNSRSIE